MRSMFPVAWFPALGGEVMGLWARSQETVRVMVDSNGRTEVYGMKNGCEGKIEIGTYCGRDREDVVICLGCLKREGGLT